MEDKFDFEGCKVGRGTYGHVYKAKQKDWYTKHIIFSVELPPLCTCIFWVIATQLSISMLLFYFSLKSKWEIFRSQADRRDRHLDVSMPRDSSKCTDVYV